MVHYPEVFVDDGTILATCPCEPWQEEHGTMEAADRAASRHPDPVPVICCTCGYQPPNEVFEQFERGEIATRADFDDRLEALHREFDGAHYENWVEVDE